MLYFTVMNAVLSLTSAWAAKPTPPIITLSETPAVDMVVTKEMIYALLAGQLWIIVQGMFKYIVDRKNKLEDTTAQDIKSFKESTGLELKAITGMIHEMKGQLHSLASQEHPDQEKIMQALRPQMELYIYRVIRDIEREEIKRNGKS